MEKGKLCTKCLHWKELTFFHRDKYMRDGYTYQCKECRNDYHQEIRIKTNYAKDHEQKARLRSDPVYRKMEVVSHLEYTRKHAKKFADYEKKRRNEESIGERTIRLAKLRLSGRRRKYRGKIENILEFAKYSISI